MKHNDTFEFLGIVSLVILVCFLIITTVGVWVDDGRITEVEKQIKILNHVIKPCAFHYDGSCQ